MSSSTDAYMFGTSMCHRLFHHSKYRGTEFTFRYLLDHKATVDSMDRKFQTPLHHACQHNSGDMVFLLLDSNANMYAQNKKGRTPGDLAKKYKQSDAYKVILQAQGVLPLDEDVDT